MEENPYKAPVDFKPPKPARPAVSPVTWGTVGLGIGTFAMLPFVDYPISALCGGVPAGIVLFLFGAYIAGGSGPQPPA